MYLSRPPFNLLVPVLARAKLLLRSIIQLSERRSRRDLVYLIVEGFFKGTEVLFDIRKVITSRHDMFEGVQSFRLSLYRATS